MTVYSTRVCISVRYSHPPAQSKCRHFRAATPYTAFRDYANASYTSQRFSSPKGDGSDQRKAKAAILSYFSPICISKSSFSTPSLQFSNRTHAGIHNASLNLLLHRKMLQIPVRPDLIGCGPDLAFFYNLS